MKKYRIISNTVGFKVQRYKKGIFEKDCSIWITEISRPGWKTVLEFDTIYKARKHVERLKYLDREREIEREREKEYKKHSWEVIEGDE